MKKWLSGIVATILSSVIIFIVTDQIKKLQDHTSEQPDKYEHAHLVMRSPNLGIEFYQNNKRIPLVYSDETNNELSVTLQTHAFEIRWPINPNWRATSMGSPGCRPTEGLRIAIAQTKRIYETPIINKKNPRGDTFFGCINMMLSSQYGNGDLVIWKAKYETGFTYLGNDKSEKPDNHTRIYRVSKIRETNTLNKENYISKGRELFADFFIDKNGDDILQADELEKISIEFK